MTGRYPAWWQGKRFDHPIEAWAAGDTNQTTRDIIQAKLLGPEGARGTGMIPGDAIAHVANKQGLAGAVETVYVRHRSGGRSALGFKSYEQGRESFQGTAKHLVWFDEEPPLGVYVEGLMRTATTDGIVMLTFTPLNGMSDVVKSFFEPESEEARRVKHVTTASWDDVPHLSEEAKAQLLASIPPYARDARTKGIPQLGVGAIYPVAESDVVTQPFELPAHWPRAYAVDVGWNRTAAVWGALDRATDTLYLYHEHYRSQAEPAVHAEAIRAAGAWMPGVIDPACLGSNLTDGRNLMEIYRSMGLDIEPAANAVESGIYAVWQRLSAGRLKVFRTLGNWISEFRKYHRDDKGRIVKEDDHLMDATRYLVVSGIARMRTGPAGPQATEPEWTAGGEDAWMG